MKKLYEESDVQAIANAIREMSDSVGTYKVSEMADAVRNIERVQKPYVLETYDGDALIGAKLVGHTAVRNRMFYSTTTLTTLELPSEVEYIGVYGIGQCYGLSEIDLPENLQRIDTGAMSECTGLTSLVIPSKVRTIAGNAFYGCTGLTEVTFKGIPTTIGSTIFTNCRNLTTINVPWPEGAVADAPWGAENATIHYNQVDSSYTKVEYIEVTGTQEIVDEALVYADGTHEYDIQFTEAGTRQLMGYSTKVACYWGVSADGLFELGGNCTISAANANPLERNTVVFSIRNATATLTVGENSISRNGLISSGAVYCIFNMPNSNNVDYHCKAKLYGCTHKDAEGNLDRNYVPCTRNSDGAAGLYDTVNGVFLELVES